MSNWIEKLKVGDLVFVNGRFNTALQKVEKITPAGNIKVNGVLFNSKGYERTSDKWNIRNLSQATPEAIKSYSEKLTIKKAFKLMQETKKITLEQANKIIELLDNSTKKSGAE